jgi:hypothetical protein
MSRCSECGSEPSHRVLWKAGNFLTNRADVSFLKRILLCWIGQIVDCFEWGLPLVERRVNVISLEHISFVVVYSRVPQFDIDFVRLRTWFQSQCSSYRIYSAAWSRCSLVDTSVPLLQSSIHRCIIIINDHKLCDKFDQLTQLSSQRRSSLWFRLHLFLG